nr:MAG TPA: hypothetical protein [Caudoviricetes sp.]
MRGRAVFELRWFDWRLHSPAPCFDCSSPIPPTSHYFKHQRKAMTTKQPDWEAIERAYRAGLHCG